MFRNELKQSIVPFCRLSAHMLAVTLNFLWFLFNSKNPALLRWLFSV